MWIRNVWLLCWVIDPLGLKGHDGSHQPSFIKYLKRSGFRQGCQIIIRYVFKTKVCLKCVKVIIRTHEIALTSIETSVLYPPKRCAAMTFWPECAGVVYSQCDSLHICYVIMQKVFKIQKYQTLKYLNRKYKTIPSNTIDKILFCILDIISSLSERLPILEYTVYTLYY